MVSAPTFNASLRSPMRHSTASDDPDPGRPRRSSTWQGDYEEMDQLANAKRYAAVVRSADIDRPRARSARNRAGRHLP